MTNIKDNNVNEEHGIIDMGVDDTARRPALNEDILKVKSKHDEKRIKEFEKYHGSITDNYNLIHFLLKYRYYNNWDREVRENYLPLTSYEISNHIPGYNLVHYEHYILPFIKNCILEDFGITLKDYTHVKNDIQKEAMIRPII